MGGDYRAFGSLDGATLRVAATMMAKRDLIDQRRLLTVTFNAGHQETPATRLQFMGCVDWQDSQAGGQKPRLESCQGGGSRRSRGMHFLSQCWTAPKEKS